MVVRMWVSKGLATALIATLSAVPLRMALAASAGGPGQPVPVDQVAIHFTAPGSFEVVSQTSLMKVLAPSDELPAMGQPMSGFWFELQSAAGAVRYRRVIGNPVLIVFGGPATPEGTTKQLVEIVPPERDFALWIPQPAEGDQLVLFSSPLRPGAEAEPAMEVARLGLQSIIIP